MEALALGGERVSLEVVPYLLPRIPYLRLRCTLRALEPAHLPPYHGSLLRGAFGHALRRSVCAMGPAQPCVSCPLRRACVHTRLFETFIEEEPPPFLRGLPTPPRPYVIEPRSDRTDFAPGDPLELDLLLFGCAADLAAYVLLAVERMATTGLGWRRARFALEKAAVPAAGGGWQPLFSGGSFVAGSIPALEVAGEGSRGAANGRVTLRFATPTRLKVRGHLANAPGFRALAFAMLRRSLELAHFYVPGADLDWAFGPLLACSSSVEIAAADLHWHDWERFSQRQGTKITLGGFLGTLTLEGDLAPFASLLRTAEVLHVGKGATFGLGKMVLEA